MNRRRRYLRRRLATGPAWAIAGRPSTFLQVLRESIVPGHRLAGVECSTSQSRVAVLRVQTSDDVRYWKEYGSVVLRTVRDSQHPNHVCPVMSDARLRDRSHGPSDTRSRVRNWYWPANQERLSASRPRLLQPPRRLDSSRKDTRFVAT